MCLGVRVRTSLVEVCPATLSYRCRVFFRRVRYLIDVDKMDPAKAIKRKLHTHKRTRGVFALDTNAHVCVFSV